jgi:hypothetical protein
MPEEKITISIYKKDHARLKKKFGRAGESVAEWFRRALDESGTPKEEKPIEKSMSDKEYARFIG